MKEILSKMLFFYIEIAPYMVLGLLFVALLHRYIRKSMIARHMGHNTWLSAVKGAVLGVPLPLCSCGVVPSAVYFSRNGASRSSVISFLISTPQTGVDSIIATYGALGPVFAVFRPLAAFVSGIFGGTVTSLLTKKEMVLEDAPCEEKTCEIKQPSEEKPGIKNSLSYAFVEFLDDISVQFIVGVILAGLISVLIPDDFFGIYGIDSGPGAMGVMIVIGIPMYICATASIPIGLALLAKGVSPGAVFVFLAVGPLTNAASLTVLYRVLKAKILIIYVASGALFAIFFGLLLDYIFALRGRGPVVAGMVSEHGVQRVLTFGAALSAVFAVLLGASIFRKIYRKFLKEETMQEKETIIVGVAGMSCNHCKETVTNAISNVPGVTAVQVSLERGEAVVEGAVSVDALKDAIRGAGYSPE